MLKLPAAAHAIPRMLARTGEGLLKALLRDQFKAASAVVRGKAYAVCWIEHNGDAMMIFDNGEQLGPPMSEFSDPTF